jgi:hypothetical protein
MSSSVTAALKHYELSDEVLEAQKLDLQVAMPEDMRYTTRTSWCVLVQLQMKVFKTMFNLSV